MNASITALIIAIVGVLGTLVAPIVSQRLSAGVRREEFERQRSQRKDEYGREQQEKVLAIKRSCYVTVISAARRYRLELMGYLHAVNHGSVDDNARDRLEEARLVFNTSLAETQLTGTASVLEALEPIRKGMSVSYVDIKNIEEQRETESNRSFDEIRIFLLELWDEWKPLLRDYARRPWRERLSWISVKQHACSGGILGYATGMPHPSGNASSRLRRFAVRVSGLASGLPLPSGSGPSARHVTVLTSVTRTSPTLNTGVACCPYASLISAAPQGR
jgi:hypothetical protein